MCRDGDRTRGFARCQSCPRAVWPLNYRSYRGGSPARGPRATSSTPRWIIPAQEVAAVEIEGVDESPAPGPATSSSGVLQVLHRVSDRRDTS